MPQKKTEKHPVHPGEETIMFYPGIEETTIKTIGIDKINLDRNEFEFRLTTRFKDLQEDIYQNGQQFPIIVRKITDTYQYQVISGFRRVRALLELEIPEVKAIVRDLDDDEAYKISFMENEKRKNLTAVDKAHAIAKLRVLGKDDDEICVIYGIGSKQLGKYEKVGTFPKVLKDAISMEHIQTSHGFLLAQAHETHGKKVNLDVWVLRVVEQGMSVRQLQRALNKEYGKGKKKKVRYFERKGKGFRLFPMRYDPAKTDEETKKKMAEKLREALGMLEGE